MLGPIRDPTTAPQIIKQIFCFGSVFKTFLGGKLFKCLLGAFLSLLCSSWEPPRREKYGFLIVKSHFLKMMLFGALRLLMSSVGSSWHLLAHSCPKMDPKMDPKSNLKNVKKRPPNCSNFRPYFRPHVGHHFGSHRPSLRPKTQQPISPWQTPFSFRFHKTA